MHTDTGSISTNVPFNSFDALPHDCKPCGVKAYPDLHHLMGIALIVQSIFLQGLGTTAAWMTEEHLEVGCRWRLVHIFPAHLSTSDFRSHRNSGQRQWDSPQAMVPMRCNSLAMVDVQHPLAKGCGNIIWSSKEASRCTVRDEASS